MKKYFNNVTGESFTLEELEKAFEDVREDINVDDFEDWLDDQIASGRSGADGLVPFEYEVIAVGGEDDGMTVAVYEDRADGINFIYDHQDDDQMYALIDADGNDVEC